VIVSIIYISQAHFVYVVSTGFLSEHSFAPFIIAGNFVIAFLLRELTITYDETNCGKKMRKSVIS